LFGVGYASFIDGGTTGDAIELNAANCRIDNLRLQTTAAGGQAYRGIDLQAGADDCVISRVIISGSDDDGINGNSTATNNMIYGCTVEACDGTGIEVNGSLNIVNCVVKDTVTWTGNGDNSVIVGSYVSGAITIHADAENCVVVGNRAPGGITDNSGTSTVASNDET